MEIGKLETGKQAYKLTKLNIGFLLALPSQILDFFLKKKKKKEKFKNKRKPVIWLTTGLK
jgi:hypothetical protein